MYLIKLFLVFLTEYIIYYVHGSIYAAKRERERERESRDTSVSDMCNVHFQIFILSYPDQKSPSRANPPPKNHNLPLPSSAHPAHRSTPSVSFTSKTSSFILSLILAANGSVSSSSNSDLMPRPNIVQEDCFNVGTRPYAGRGTMWKCTWGTTWAARGPGIEDRGLVDAQSMILRRKMDGIAYLGHNHQHGRDSGFQSNLTPY